jgi:hypothetical protein
MQPMWPASACIGGNLTPMNFYWVLSIEDFSYSSGAKVCQMEEKDISACAKLHLEALGYDHEEELL